MKTGKILRQSLASLLALLICFSAASPLSLAYTTEEMSTDDGIIISPEDEEVTDGSDDETDTETTPVEGEAPGLTDEETADFIYDPQPDTIEDVRVAIDAYTAEYYEILQTEGFLAALEVPKPRWQYEVADELMPEGWHCALVDWDEDFGAVYYTFFPNPAAMGYGDGGYVEKPPAGYGTDVTERFHIIENTKVDTQYKNVAIVSLDAQNQFGAMWAKEKLDLTLPFKTEMYLHLGHADTKSGIVADGMTFTLHNDSRGLTAIGGKGEGLGVYTGRQSGLKHGEYLKNALAIEFDTYLNEDDGWSYVADPESSGYSAHSALIITNEITPTDDYIKISVSDHKNVYYFNPVQDWVKFEAEWIPDGYNGGKLIYIFDGKREEYIIDDVIDVFNGTEVYWGFTGSTGTHTALQAAAITKLPTQEFIAVKTVKNTEGEVVDGGEAKVGDILHYTIDVTANIAIDGIGPVTIIDTLSPYVKYVNGTAIMTSSSAPDTPVPVTPVIEGSTLTIETGTILYNVGDSLTITFDVMVQESGQGNKVNNIATVVADKLTEPQTTNTTEVSITGSYKCMVDSDGAPVKVGDEITYRIGYVNPTGEEAILTITDVLDIGLTYVPGSDGGSYDEGSRTVTWNVGTVAEDGVGFVTLTVKVNGNAGAAITNKAGMEWASTGGGGTETENPEIEVLIRYTVTYEANSGSGGYVDEDFELGSEYTILSQAATGISRSGYSFIEWNTAADGSGTAYNADSPVIIEGNMVLYAQWRNNAGGRTETYDVIYHANNGLGEADIIQSGYSEGNTVTVRGELFTAPEGKEFVGWSTRPSGSVEYTEGNTFRMPTADVNLYAVWKDKSSEKGPSGLDKYEIPDEEIPFGFLDLNNHYAYIIGYPDGNIRPQGQVTREEVATIFFRLLTIETRMEYWSDTNSFSDVSSDRWSNNAISTLVNAGILKGYPDGTFRPDEYITRAELAVIAARFNKEATTDIQEFSDISGHWARNYIMRAALRGWVNGYEDGTFRPDAYITRAEVMTLINRGLDRQVEATEDMLEDMTKWPDNAESAWYYLDVQEATNSHFFDRKEDNINEIWTALRITPDWSLLEKHGAEAGDISY